MKKRVPTETIDFFNGFGYEERSTLKQIIHAEAVAEVKSHFAKYAYQ